jgi:hypothetical protein
LLVRHATESGYISLKNKVDVLALALLAVMVGAIVQVVVTSGPFTLWQTFVGLTMLFTALAYGKDVRGSFCANLAYSLVCAAALVFTFGVWIDIYLRKIGITEWKCTDQPCRVFSKAGFVTESMQDDIFGIAGLSLAIVIFAGRALTVPRKPQSL